MKNYIQAIVKMDSQNNTHAIELHEAEKVLDMIFVLSRQSAEVVQPGEQSLLGLRAVSMFGISKY